MLNLKPARILPIMIGGLVLFGCDVQRSAGPNDVPQFSRSITLPGLDSLLGAGPARVKIWLMPGTLVARRVVVKQTEQLTRSERIDGRVTAIAASATADTLSLTIGDLKIVVNSDTKFTGQHEEGDDDDNHPSPTSLAEFTMRVQHARGRETSGHRSAATGAGNAASAGGRALHGRCGAARRRSRPSQHRDERHQRERPLQLESAARRLAAGARPEDRAASQRRDDADKTGDARDRR